MNENNIELSNIKSSKSNKMENFDFNKNQEHENNPTSEFDSGFYNGTTNMTLDINNNNPITGIHGFNTFDYKKKNKSNHKILKSWILIKNLGKKVYMSFRILINHLYFLNGRNIRVQVGIVYSLLMIILTMGISYIKFKYIVDIIDTLTNKNYFSFYVNNIIYSQREIKVHLDELNNHDIMSSSSDALLFNRLYTEELVENKILNRDSLILEENLQNIYSELGDIYELSDDLYKLAEIYGNSFSEYHLEYNIKNMMPFYYHFTPIIINHLNFCGIHLKNFFFIARGDLECNNKIMGRDTINTMYFKYPLENLNLEPDIKQKNNKIYDFIIDPYSSCNNDYYGQDGLINDIKINNWFSRCLREDNLYFRIFKLKKLTNDKQKRDYLIYFAKSDNLDYDNLNKIFFSFTMKISQNEYIYPFIKLNERDDILNYDYLSIYNFQKEFEPLESEVISLNKYFKIDYDIDDTKNLLFKTPKFISNMHLYSMKEFEIENDKGNNNLKDIEYELLKYKEMVNMSEYYDINYYFKKDSLLFRLIYFLNHFFLFKKKHPEYLTEKYESLRNNIETNSDHPCAFPGSQEYYKEIKDDYGYDCQNDFCFYNDCDQSFNNFQDPKKLYYLPNCYCIPLFCRDRLSQNSEFHENLKGIIKKMNNSFSDNAYSFTSSYKDYLTKKNYKFSSIDNFFERKNFIFKCKITFNQKNNTNNNFYKMIIKMQNLAHQYGDSTFLMFFMNNNMTSYLVYNFLRYNTIFMIYVFGVYICFMLCSLIILIRYIVSQVNNLTNRIEKIKKIRRTIISNQIENKNISSEDNYNLESLSNINDDSSSDSSNDSNNIKKKEKKENLDENNKNGELDELDTLINLVNENVAEFQIKFNITEDMNSTINEIKNLYNGIIKVNQYKNKLLMNNYNNNINNNSIDEDDISYISSVDENEENFDDLSLKMFYELLSTSTSEIDFSNIKTNFYFRKNDGKLIFGLEEILPSFNDEDSNGNGEITNLNKIKNAINYYYFNIHNYWKQQYINLKKEENI